MITAQGTGSIPALSARFGVSEMTIRRDLRTLEKSGHLHTTRGGAVAFTEGALQAELRYTSKKRLHMAEKMHIARYAVANFVEDNDIIVMEPGTTVAAMAQFMTARTNLTIVTNGLYTTNELRALLRGSNIICTGGILRDVSLTFVGPLAERFFKEFYARKLFLSGIGFTLDAGLTDPQMIDTQVKKAMIGAVDQVIVLIDSSKLGVKSLTQVLGPYEAHILITDSGAPPDLVADLRLHGVDVRIADE